jgi:hypothetical protein
MLKLNDSVNVTSKHDRFEKQQNDTGSRRNVNSVCKRRNVFAWRENNN